ncbi:MAG: carbohydrate binding domain-containing protein, partial [Prevotella sp.]|nr:carbohydrate binding domain-containing protein [Prevotella sp.]
MAALPVSADEGLHPFVLDAKKLGSPIQTTMYGIFFEDINFGADGGLYAEMVENRSFEFPQSLMGWNTFGKVSLSTDRPAFERNPHYVTIFDPGHREKRSGIDNHGFFGMGFKKDMKYFFSVYGRLHAADGKSTEIRVELIDENNEIIDKQTVTINSKDWKKYEVNLTSKKTVAKGGLRIF